MKTKLTVVVDNVASNGYEAEWGLSILAEYGTQKILVDCGSSDIFAENMEKLGLDIEAVDYGVLSHAHYDHANGIPYFLEHNDKAKFYLRDTTRDNCYRTRWFFFKKYIGVPKDLLTKYGNRIELVKGDYKLCEGAYLIPHKTRHLGKIGEREKMFIKAEDGWRYDDFSHEQSLVLDTDKGLVIINSCSHGGAVNIIREVQETFPDKHIYSLVGGLHLFNKSREEVQEVARGIMDTGIEYIYTGHCTKDRAYNILKEELGDNIIKFHVGLKLEF